MLETQLFILEVAFLNGNLDEEIYLECLNGMIHFSDKCLLLIKAFYGQFKQPEKASKNLFP